MESRTVVYSYSRIYQLNTINMDDDMYYINVDEDTIEDPDDGLYNY